MIVRNSSSQKENLTLTIITIAQEFELAVLLKKNNDEKNTSQKPKLKALSQKKRVNNKQTDYDETKA